ncbi:hypothetical protein ACTMU2_36430 [Cupriavidus basilensis]
MLFVTIDPERDTQGAAGAVCAGV